MISRYGIDYHPLVDDDLFGISFFIEKYAGSIVADRKLSELEKSMRRLSDFPHVGSRRDDIHPGLRAIPAAEKGVICFTVDENARRVFIIAVTYAGADWQARVAERN